MRIVRATAALLAGVAGIAAAPSSSPPPPPMPVALRMNDIQVLGSHNSFKARIPAAVMARMVAANPAGAAGLDYYHLPIMAQLDRGIRQLELDVFADPAGGRYARPHGAALAARAEGAALVAQAGAADGFDAAAMAAPGFKVLHVPDVDYRSDCPTLVRCLTAIDGWSRVHPRHVPLMITINAKDTSFGVPGSTDPLPLTPALLDALDAEIRATLTPGRLVTPDAVRGTAATLDGAVRGRGWPRLDTVRGRIYIVFDVVPVVADRYRAGHPALRGRAMFGPYAAGEAEAATMIVQDPLVDGDAIRTLVRQGYIVRTRTDANTVEARRHDLRKRDAALASGAQAVSTDYYPGAPDPIGARFVVAMPGGGTIRCNPLRIAAPCALSE